jgi:hypothetical protein
MINGTDRSLYSMFCFAVRCQYPTLTKNKNENKLPFHGNDERHGGHFTALPMMLSCIDNPIVL